MPLKTMDRFSLEHLLLKFYAEYAKRLVGITRKKATPESIDLFRKAALTLAAECDRRDGIRT